MRSQILQGLAFSPPQDRALAVDVVRNIAHPATDIKHSAVSILLISPGGARNTTDSFRILPA
jgi:hypothetical protein